MILIYNSAEREEFINEKSLITNFTDPIAKYKKVDYYVLRCLINSISEESVFDIKYNKYGKPYLKQNQNIYFNISNSNNTVCIGISDQPIGVDLEYVKPRNIKAIMQFLHSSECEYINSSGSSECAFYEIWTMKEAYLKYLGTGFHKPFNQIEITLLNNKFKIYDCNELVKIQTCSININNSYILGICSKHRFEGSLLSLDDLININPLIQY